MTSSPPAPDDDALQLAVHRSDAASRYEGWVGDELVGVADYTLSEPVLSINHTGTDPAWRGRGIAGRLTRFALDDIRASGRKVRPVCPYTESFIDEHPDYRDLLA